MDAEQIYENVQKRYSSVAKSTSNGYSQTIAKAFGYTEDELAEIPQDANLGLSCGNPLASAKLREGETVIDLGSGAGFDVFLAAKKIGANGKVIGVDMNKDMLERAHRNKAKINLDNILFVESDIAEIALPDATADCIISNCVVNLVPEQRKQLVFKEMFRLLKPGGRVAISDILTRKELPDELKKSMALYVGCIAGASRVEDYETYLRCAGFSDAVLIDSKRNLNIYRQTNEDGSKNKCCGSGTDEQCCGKPASCCNDDGTAPGDGPRVVQSQFENVDFNEWAGSFHVYAMKPQN